MSMDNSGVVGKFRSFYSTIEQVRSFLFPCLLCFNQQICVLFNFLVLRSSTSVLDGLQIPRMKKIPMGVLDNRRFAGFLQAVFSTFLGTQPFPAHILPCLEELPKELPTSSAQQPKHQRCRKSLSVNADNLEDRVSHCASVNMSSWLPAGSHQETNSMSLSS